MFENLIIIFLAIAGIVIAFGLLFSLGSLYFKHYEKKNIDINEKYCFEKANIREQRKIVKDLAETLIQEKDNLNDKIEMFKNKLTNREYQAIPFNYTEYQYIDLKDKDYENIILRYKFLTKSMD